jgi:hypothetical protein
MNSEPIYLVAGMEVSKAFYDIAEATFPDNVDAPFALITESATKEMMRLLHLRWLASVTGAMRWPESQEAAIYRTKSSKMNYV